MCRSAARIREGLSWGSRWYKPKESTLSGAFFDPGRFRSAGTGALIWGKEKAWSTTRLQASACGRSGPFRSQTVWYHKKGGACVGNRRFLPHMERCGSPRRSGQHLAMPNALAAKEKGTFRCPFLLVMAVTLDQPGRVCKFRKKEKARSASGSRPLPGGAEDGTRTHTPKYWLLRPERLPFRHFRLFHFGPAHSQNSRPTSTRIIPFLALPCQFPGLSPPFGGCLSTGVVLG